MLGAIIGDMVGSIYEWDNIKKKEFPFFRSECFPTDDSIMTIAVAKAILDNNGQFEGLKNKSIEWMQKIGRQYPNCGYGGRFRRWMSSRDPKPYLSFGNGSAMRVSACGWAGSSPEEVKQLSYAVTAVTHDHPEGLKGAEATACAIFLARTGYSKDEIRAYIEENYYELDAQSRGTRFIVYGAVGVVLSVVLFFVFDKKYSFLIPFLYSLVVFIKGIEIAKKK